MTAPDLDDDRELPDLEQDDEELTDEQADALVGTVDDDDPLELEEGNEDEVAPIPDTWDSEAHAEELAADELVDTTPTDDDGEPA